MKASESLPNYESKSRETTNFIIKSIKQVCKDSPSRKAGSEGENNAQQFVASTMEKFADSIETQDITVKSAKASTPVLQGIFCIFSIVFACVAGFIPVITTHLMFSAVVFMALSVLCPALKATKNSKNVICVKNPSGEKKRRIVFVGNINSPIERKLLRISGPALEKFAYFYFTIGCLICIVFDGFYVACGYTLLGPYVILFEIAFIPACVIYMNFYNAKQDIQGAVGNLTGVFDSLAVMQYLSYNNLSLENTELVSVSAGAGAYGAREFVRKYSPKYSDIPTLFVSVDCLQSTESFSVSAVNTSSDILTAASQNASVNVVEGKDTISSSLLAAMKNEKALRISAADLNEKFVYATREDVITEISPMAIEAGLKLSLETAYLFDEKGI